MMDLPIGTDVGVTAIGVLDVPVEVLLRAAWTGCGDPLIIVHIAIPLVFATRRVL
jgi:hypothetical protein